MMRALQNRFLYNQDDPPGGGLPADPPADDPQDDPPADPPAPPELSLEDMEARLRAAGRWQEPIPAKPSSDVEYIEGTNIVKPDGYDTWSIDKSIAYVSQQTQAQAFQLQTSASRVVREVEAKGEAWYADQLRDVLESMNPLWLANASADEKAGLLQLAIGKAVQEGKSPQSNSKPVPGASPTSTRATTVSTPPSEVERELQGIRDAGYGRVADSPVIKAILERAS